MDKQKYYNLLYDTTCYVIQYVVCYVVLKSLFLIELQPPLASVHSSSYFKREWKIIKEYDSI